MVRWATAKERETGKTAPCKRETWSRGVCCHRHSNDTFLCRTGKFGQSDEKYQNLEHQRNSKKYTRGKEREKERERQEQTWEGESEKLAVLTQLTMSEERGEREKERETGEREKEREKHSRSIINKAPSVLAWREHPTFFLPFQEMATWKYEWLTRKGKGNRER